MTQRYVFKSFKLAQHHHSHRITPVDLFIFVSSLQQLNAF